MYIYFFLIKLILSFIPYNFIYVPQFVNNYFYTSSLLKVKAAKCIYKLNNIYKIVNTFL